MKNKLRMPPGLVIVLLLLSCLVPSLLFFPYKYGVPMAAPAPTATATPPVTPTPAQPAPWCIDQAEHFFADNPTDKVQAGPGSDFKESLHAFGPSAVPVNDATMTPTQRLEAVKALFMQRNCLDEKLFQVGYASLDVKHLARAPYHPDMNPNTPQGTAWWRAEQDTYFGAIRWDLSSVVVQTIPAGTWTLTMVAVHGGEPVVKAVRLAQASASHVLILAVTQPDGTMAYDHRRLECGFQNLYKTKGEVPAALLA